MRREFINKIILGTLISTTLCTLVPVRASAEWVKDYQNNLYYTQDNQKMTGWKKIDGQLYYFDDNGKMQTGWIQAGDLWYFLQSNGALKTGWINYNKKSYYADSSGAIQTGTINIAGKVYMFDNNGVMKTSNAVIDGQFYTIGLNGEVVGNAVPTPDKELDESGNLITVLKNTDNATITSPTDSKYNEVIKDESVSDDDPNEGRTFKVNFKDSNGTELKTKNVKNAKKVDLYKPTKEGYGFASWNTKSDGSGKSYDGNDDIKVKEDINLYAQWTDDTTIYVTSLTVKGNSNVQIGKTAQMTADILPLDSGSAVVTWTVASGSATIDSNGLLTGVSEGTVTVKATATAKDGSKISGSKQVIVSQTSVVVPVTSISLSSKTGATTITANGGTLQMTAGVLPEDASDQTVTWSVENRSGSAKIDPSTGLLTAVGNGTVTVKATANNGVVQSTTISISGQTVNTLADSITITSSVDEIATDDGTATMTANVLPTNATNKGVTWSVDNKAIATISSTGLLKAMSNGTVTVNATATDGSGKVATKTIKISGQTTQVTGVTVTGKDDAEKIIGPTNKTLQMSATVSPTDAINQKVKWTVMQAGDTLTTMTGLATIDSDGLLTAVANGTVTVVATSENNTKVIGSKVIEIIGQDIPVTKISVAGTSNADTITSDKGRLQMLATVTPTYTTQQAVTWSVPDGTNSSGKVYATIDELGVLSAIANGTVTVKATSKDNTNVFGTKQITISGQLIKVNGITVTSTTGVGVTTDTITDDAGTLLMSASASPIDASDKSITWSVENGADSYKTGKATIIPSGGTAILKAEANGEVLVKATANDGSGIVGTQRIKISGQHIKVSQITVTGFVPGTNQISKSSIITGDGGTLDMQAVVEPDNAYEKGVLWTVETVSNGTGMTGDASINPVSGLLTAKANGTVKVKAIANDKSGIAGESEVITISGLTVKVESILVTAFSSTVTVGTTVQMTATISPATATNKDVIWTVDDQNIAKVGSDGKLTGIAKGTVTVKATSKYDSTKFGTTTITVNP